MMLLAYPAYFLYRAVIGLWSLKWLLLMLALLWWLS